MQSVDDLPQERVLTCPDLFPVLCFRHKVAFSARCGRFLSLAALHFLVQPAGFCLRRFIFSFDDFVRLLLTIDFLRCCLALDSIWNFCFILSSSLLCAYSGIRMNLDLNTRFFYPPLGQGFRIFKLIYIFKRCMSCLSRIIWCSKID